MARFYLRDATGVQGLLTLASENSVALNRQAIEHARDTLSDDWLTLVDAGWPNCICSLSMSAGQGSTALALSQWMEIVDSLNLLRNTDGIAEQIRRLRIFSHERLDTALVIVIAGRYKARGWEVVFEPNGRGCSDLRVTAQDQRFYIEVKRENLQDHDRYKTFNANAGELVGSVQASLGEWLGSNDLRVEVKFSRGFSESVVKKVHSELIQKVPNAPVRTEQALTIPFDSKFVVVRTEDIYFEKGFSMGRITVKQPGVPIQVHPKNMPVRVIFEWPPNFRVVRRLIREAKRQLANDIRVDTTARGFVVVQATGGTELAQVLDKTLLRTLPAYCLGVVVLSDFPDALGHLVCRDGLVEKLIRAMSTAVGEG
jgi:hypothetical protein